MKNNIIISTIIGLIVSILMMNVAWKHNSQGEIHSEGVIDFSYWVLIGMTWFIMTFIVIFILIFIVKKIFSVVDKK